jgi:putative transposase
MSRRSKGSPARSTYEFIKAHSDRFGVRTMCRILGVASSGYYKWLLHPLSNREQKDARVLRLIRASFTASHGIYRARRTSGLKRSLPRCWCEPRRAHSSRS